jgi:hypothetical protein
VGHRRAAATPARSPTRTLGSASTRSVAGPSADDTPRCSHTRSCTACGQRADEAQFRRQLRRGEARHEWSTAG